MLFFNCDTDIEGYPVPPDTKHAQSASAKNIFSSCLSLCQGYTKTF